MSDFLKKSLKYERYIKISLIVGFFIISIFLINKYSLGETQNFGIALSSLEENIQEEAEVLFIKSDNQNITVEKALRGGADCINYKNYSNSFLRIDISECKDYDGVMDGFIISDKNLFKD